MMSSVSKTDFIGDYLVPPIVWICDASGRLSSFNGRSLDRQDCSLASELSCCVPASDLRAVQREWDKARNTSSPFTCEFRLNRAQGLPYRWHLAQAQPICDEQRNVLQWQGTLTDIDAYKLHHDNTGLQFQALAEGLKDQAILLLDAKGRVKSWNKSMERLTGYQAPEILNQHLSVFFVATDTASREPDRYLARAQAEGSATQQGWRIGRDGSHLWVSTVITPLFDAEGSLSGFSEAIRDLTEERQLYRLLAVERQRADSADRTRTAFLTSMSHEIRTPMNALLGMADMLWESELSDSQRHYVEVFRQAGESLFKVINDTLDLTKLEAGNLSLQEITFQVEEVVERVLATLLPAANAKGLHLHSRLALDSAPLVIGDPARFEEILLNLLSYAIHSTDRGEVLLEGLSRSSENRATLEFQIRHTTAAFVSQESGAIRPQAERPGSSTPLFRSLPEAGIALSYALIKHMCGEIETGDEPGRGNVVSFRVTLPIDSQRNILPPARPVSPDVTPAANEQVAPRLPAGNTIKPMRKIPILVAEDSEDNRFLLKAYCHGTVYELTFVEHGALAVAAFRDDLFDLIVMDVQMPVMDGLTATREIRAIETARGGNRIPILALTANVLPQDVTRAREAGCDAHLPKPISKKSFLAGVEQWLKKAEASVQPGSPSSAAPSRSSEKSEVHH